MPHVEVFCKHGESKNKVCQCCGFTTFFDLLNGKMDHGFFQYVQRLLKKIMCTANFDKICCWVNACVFPTRSLLVHWSLCCTPSVWQQRERCCDNSSETGAEDEERLDTHRAPASWAVWCRSVVLSVTVCLWVCVCVCVCDWLCICHCVGLSVPFTWSPIPGVFKPSCYKL